MKLYRGDNIFNKTTRPGIFRGNGLMSRAFFGKIDLNNLKSSNIDPEIFGPTNIERIGLVNAMNKHIVLNTFPCGLYYYVSDFISFTSSKEVAKKFCCGNNGKAIEKTEDYEETNYIFELDVILEPIDKETLESILHIEPPYDGIYTFSYVCNPSLKAPDNKSYLLPTTGCKICNGTECKHRLLLIDVKTYLGKRNDRSNYIKAIENAERDKEWLVLSLDLLPDGFRANRIHRADFWKAELYRSYDIRPEYFGQSEGCIFDIKETDGLSEGLGLS